MLTRAGYKFPMPRLVQSFQFELLGSLFGTFTQQLQVQVGQILGLPGLRGYQVLLRRIHECSLITFISLIFRVR
jgi:hypothetical protein